MYIHLQRKAFSMITAIIVIVMMGFVGAMVMSLSGKIIKETTAQFQREQAMLLAKSYTEYAIMAVMSNDRTSNCLEQINGDNVIRNESDGGYEIRVYISYISNGTGELTNCATTHIFSDTAVTTQSSLNIIIDVYVRYKDFDSHAIASDGSMTNVPYITYHKRTLQKI